MKHQPIEESQGDDFQNIKGEVHELTCYESCLQCCGNFCGCLNIWCPCICCCCPSPIYTVQTAKVGVHQSFGRYVDILKPGLHLVNPMSENVIQVDMKTVVFSMPPQQIITKDNVSLQIETVVYYRSINPYKLVYKLNNDARKMRQFISEIAFSAMRTVTGENTFQELLVSRSEIAEKLEEYIKQKVYPWGLYIENLFIKDLILSQQVKTNLQAAAVQRRLAQATIISAKADVQAAKLLKETSQILNSTSAMQIRYLQAVQNIVAKNGNSMMFMNLKGKD